MPPFEEFKKQVSPAPDSWAERTVVDWVRKYEHAADFVVLPKGGESTERQIGKTRMKPLGWWLLAGMALAFTAAYRSTLGVWTLIAIGYAFGVFLVGQANPRYLCPSWPVMIVLLAVPADVSAPVGRFSGEAEKRQHWDPMNERLVELRSVALGGRSSGACVVLHLLCPEHTA